jgi:predicted HicB family RNase H-like nuclease
MTNELTYKGYHGTVELSADDRCFFGVVRGIRALVTFEGDTIDSLEKSFHESVDAYIDLCERNNREPEREYAGEYRFRPGAELHKRLAQLAARKNESLNSITISACEYYIEDTDSAIAHGR